MGISEYVYPNSGRLKAKLLFREVEGAEPSRDPKKRLMALSTGGYKRGPRFAYRVYFCKALNTYSVSVISEAAESLGKQKLRTYSVQLREGITLESVITAALYQEYVDRTMAFRERKKFELQKSVVRAVDIHWDTDGEDVSLPTQIEIPAGMTDLEAISDYISEVTGYCHDGFTIRRAAYGKA